MQSDSHEQPAVPTIGPASASPEDRATQVFDRFPYLVVRLAPAVYLIRLVPSGESREELVALARRQAMANRLSTCLALGLRDGVFCEPDGSVEGRNLIPRGGFQMTGTLPFPREVARHAELPGREARLEAYIRQRHPGSGTVVGDLGKGGRPATAVEAERLSGVRDGGVPRGLARCPACGEWRGECLDTHAAGGPWLVHVDCRCANETRCAACGELLCDRALNRNYYEETTGRVVHVAGFAGLGHRCAVPAT
jgi:hypothetical protein